jgi:cellulose synthase (UDP-forming)
LLIFVPPLEIYFDLRPVNLTVTWITWLLFYLGFYGMQILLAFHTMGSFRPETLVMAAVSFPIYIRAFINVFSGHEQKWHVTGSSGKRVSPFNFIIPQVLFFVFLFLTSVVGIVKDYGHETLTLATAWNVTNTIVLAVFIGAAFHESHLARVATRPRSTVYPTFARAAAPPLPVVPPVSREAHTFPAQEDEFTSPVFDEAGRISS